MREQPEGAILAAATGPERYP